MPKAGLLGPLDGAFHGLQRLVATAIQLQDLTLQRLDPITDPIKAPLLKDSQFTKSDARRVGLKRPFPLLMGADIPRQGLTEAGDLLFLEQAWRATADCKTREGRALEDLREMIDRGDKLSRVQLEVRAVTGNVQEKEAVRTTRTAKGDPDIGTKALLPVWEGTFSRSAATTRLRRRSRSVRPALHTLLMVSAQPSNGTRHPNPSRATHGLLQAASDRRRLESLKISLKTERQAVTQETGSPSGNLAGT